MTLLLKNATFINWQTLDFQNTHILVDENGIYLSDQILQADDTIDCSGMYVTKSFAVGHHHIYSALARGRPAPEKNPQNFYEILQYIWWRLDKALDKDMIEASALATAIACAKSGNTFVIDHHASPNSIEGSLNIIAKAFDKVGVSHLLCYEITDRDGMDRAEKGLSETENYLQNNQALVGLHASFTVGNDTLSNAADLMNKYHSGIHIHVAEDHYDQTHSIQNYGKRVIERLNDYGILQSPKTILAHCLHLNEDERNLINKSKAFIVQNPESNLNNQVGFFNATNLGNNIMLGTDGMHSDMLRSAQIAFFAGQGQDTIDYTSAYTRLRKVHEYLQLNNFKGDEENNLVILDYPSPTPLNKENFLGHFLFGFREEHVRHVIAKGKLIVKNRTVQTIDEQEILKFTKEQAVRLWQKMQT